MISYVTLWQVTSPFCALDFKIARRNQDPCTTDIQVHWTNYLINQPNKYLLSTYLAGCCTHRVVNQDRFGIYLPSPSSLVGCQPTKSKSPGQIQGDSTNRPYCPLLLTPEFTHLTHLGRKEKCHSMWGSGGNGRVERSSDGCCLHFIKAGAAAVSLWAGSHQCNQNHPWQLQSGKGGGEDEENGDDM